VHTSHSSKDAMQELSTGMYSLVVFNLKNFNQKKLALSKQLRKDGHNIPLVALANTSDFNTLLEISNLKKTVVLQKPFSDKELSGLIKKLIAGSDVSQQIYKRFKTNQLANLEIYPTGESHHSHIFNLSHSGAYLEVPQEANFQTGDMVRINVKLSQLNRHHDVHAEVVWMKQDASWNQGRAVGIRFMDKDEVYSHMLSNI